jgi:tRNA threonylcarbamoyladenosine biosynthesis protein TsaB
MIEAVFAESGIDKSEINAIAFGAGPGSFTGLRIAAGIAQGLAFGLDKPVIPVSTLEAAAFDPAIRNYPHAIVAAAFDARMDEIYWGVYEYRNKPVGLSHIEDQLGALVADRVIKPRLLTPAMLSLGLLPGEPGATVVGIGSGWIYQAEIEKATGLCPAIVLADEVAKASVIAELAARKYALGQLLHATEAIPVYLRDEITWKKLPGR